MNNRLQKISAFTLMELMAAMAISVVVIGLASSILNFIFNNIQSIESNYTINTQIDLLEQQLTVDLNTFHIVYFDKHSNFLKLKNELDSISYLLEESYVIRQEDSILVEDYSKKLFYQGKEVSSGTIDAVKFELSTSDKFIFCFRGTDSYEILNAYGN